MGPETWLEEVVEIVREHDILAIRPPGSDDRIDAADAFPSGFSALLRRYHVAAFQAGEVTVFGNSPSEYYTIAHLWNDANLVEPLLQAGLILFGRPDFVNYDPICFDMRNGRGIDAPIVRVDHEEILSHYRMPKPVAIADSFLGLLRRGPIQKELDT
jgi:hypothetical protein